MLQIPENREKGRRFKSQPHSSEVASSSQGTSAQSCRHIVCIHIHKERVREMALRHLRQAA